MHEYMSYAYVSGELLLQIIMGFLIVFGFILILQLINIKRKVRKSEEELNDLKDDYVQLKSENIESESLLEELNVKYEKLGKNHEEMRSYAHTDKLTDIPNENAFIEMLDNILLTIRHSEVVGIMGLDIDDFKQVNDTFGKPYGDELLIDIAHRLKQVLDENDYLARLGGDEFAIVTQNTVNTEEYEEKIKKVIKIFSYPFVLSATEHFVDVSIGAVFAPKDGSTTNELIRNLYATMNAAKLNEKNSYLYYDSSFTESRTEKIELQSEMRNAIQNNEFSNVYQPIVDLGTDRIIGFEALLRWNHPENGVVPPVRFIDAAEENGLIIPLGYQGIKEACEQLKVWHEKGYEDITVAINLSSRQLRDKDLAENIYKIIKEVEVDSSKIEFEFTENSAMQDVEKVNTIAKELSEMMVEFSLDDFGTGYSSLNFLKELPIVNLKIDNKLIETLHEEGRSKMIVGAIITLGKYLGYSITAEGVESAQQEEFLKLMKCNKAQGYLYSHPLTVKEADWILEDDKASANESPLKDEDYEEE